MNKGEAREADKLLEPYAEHTECGGLNGGGVYVAAYWYGGGQKIFEALDSVQEWVQERQNRDA